MPPRESPWPPVAAVTTLRVLFEGLVPRLAERAEEYQADVDLLDDEVWALFEGELQRALALLEAACPVRDAGTVRGRGHSLEGMGGTVGLPDLSVVGAELRQAAHEQEWDRCALLTQRLGAWVAGLGGGAGEAAAKAAGLPARPASPAAPPPSPQALVLIADDNPLGLSALRKPLRAQGYDLLEASDGLMALHLAQQRLPSLALLDVEMPGLTGYEVLRRLRADPRTREMTVILVTARSGAEDAERGLRAGAFGYVRKPFADGELLALAGNALKLQHTVDELRRSQRRMSDEIQVAWSLQRKLFPTYPRCGPGYEVHLSYAPSLSIGGDLFDAFPLPDGRLCVYMGDVAGHGVAPAIVSALLKAIITEAASGLAKAGPAAVCREIHSRFRYHVDIPELYATLFLAFLDPQRGNWTCMNCGHPDAMLLLEDGVNVSAHLVGRGDMPIGFWSGNPDGYAVDAETSAPAPPGSILWLITDGLFEARHRETGEPCGPERLLALMQRIQADGHSASPAVQLLAALRADGFELRTDDCSAMAVECVDPSSVRLERRLPLHVEAVSEAAADVERILRADGWSEEAACLARLVAMEHCTNIIDYGKAPPHSAIHFQLRVTGPMCRMWFKDQGQEWDYQARRKVTSELPLDSERGRGLMLIQTCTCHAEFFRRDHENVAFFAVDRQPAALRTIPPDAELARSSGP
jgi:sigma-B regulation protein RsbU (phosphoserine phosphatase)